MSTVAILDGSTFHPFPRLPLELRNHIWTLALQDKPALEYELRIIASVMILKYKSSHSNQIDTKTEAISPNRKDIRLLTYACPSNPIHDRGAYNHPIHLSICRESRAVVTETFIPIMRACSGCVGSEKFTGGFRIGGKRKSCQTTVMGHPLSGLDLSRCERKSPIWVHPVHDVVVSQIEADWEKWDQSGNVVFWRSKDWSSWDDGKGECVFKGDSKCCHTEGVGGRLYYNY